MPSPFPGMDPYLEHPVRWPNVHLSLLHSLRAALQPQIRPRYWVAIEERVYEALPDDLMLLGVPDAGIVDSGSGTGAGGGATATLARPIEVGVPVPEAVRERYLALRDTASGEVVTVLEVLSPTNKRPGVSRDEYLKKRNAILSSQTNLVEIDLLRAGERMPVRRAVPPYDYGVLVCRAHAWEHAQLYPFSVQERAPVFPVPLRSGEPEAPLDLNAVISQVYADGGFDLIIDYSKPPVPPLGPEDAG